MNCFLCLEGSDVFFNIYDEFQQEAYNFCLVEPIAKYFSFKPSTESASICETCFNIITPFHIFCLQIEETHNKVFALKKKLNAEAKKANDLNVSNENNDNKNRNKKSINNLLEDNSIKKKLENLKSTQSDTDKKLDANIIPKQEIDIGDTELVDFNTTQTDTFDNKITTFSEYDSHNTLPILRQEDYSTNRNFNDNDCYIDNNVDQYSSIFHLNKNRILAKRMKLKNKNKIRDKRRKERTDWYINRKISKFMKLNCDICNNEISTFKALQKHFECNHGELGYAICCGEKFYKRYLLVHHIDFHLASNNFKSNLANQKNTDKLNMVENYDEHKEIKEKLQCNQCDKTFSRVWTLKQHQAYHSPKETWKYKCEECKKLLPTHCHLNSHIYFAHKEKFIQCHVCYKRLRAAHLNKHLKNHPKNEKEKSDNERTYEYEDEESHSEYEKVDGNTHSDREEQMFVEEDVKHFACSTCSELFNSEEDLEIHIDNEHTKTFMYAQNL